MRGQSLTRQILILAAIAALLALAWVLWEVVLLAFAAAVLAILLRGFARNIERLLPLTPTWSLVLAVVIVLLVVGGAIMLFGVQVGAQIDTLFDALPRAWDAARERLREFGPIGTWVDSLGDKAFADGNITGRLTGFLSTALGIAADLLLILAGALYFAIQPAMYRDGLVVLFPPAQRAHASDALNRCGDALWQWMLGQLISMAIVGVLTTTALTLIGLPTALALGLFAGLAEFVPVVGPIAAAVPALIIALSQSYEMTLWVLAAFVVIQQVEGYVLQPLVQRRMVSLPPALLLFSIVAMAILFGGLGVVLAAPLTVVLFVLVREVYLRDTLGEKVKPVVPRKK
jgi:predicted PurR-regulated permease PerM